MIVVMFVFLSQPNLLTQELKIAQVKDSREWLREFENVKVLVLLEMLKCTNERGGDPL